MIGDSLRLLVQFGPQSVRQRCVVSSNFLQFLSPPSAGPDRGSCLVPINKRVAEFMLVFELIQQLDFTKTAFVGHVGGAQIYDYLCSSVDDLSEETNEGLLRTFLVGLSRFAPSFTHRCIWRALLFNQLSVGVLDESNGQFEPLSGLDTIRDGSTMIIASPTSEDLGCGAVDEDYTQQILSSLSEHDATGSNSPTGILQWVSALVRAEKTTSLDDVGIRAVIKEISSESVAFPFYSAVCCPVVGGAAMVMNAQASSSSQLLARTAVAGDKLNPIWTGFPRKAPLCMVCTPNYSEPRPAPQSPLDVDSIFDSLHVKGGRKTLESLRILPPKPPRTRYEILMEVKESDKPPPPPQLETRIVDSGVVLEWLKAEYPFIDHGNGRGYDALLASCFNRPLRDCNGNIVAGYRESPVTTSGIRTVALEPRGVSVHRISIGRASDEASQRRIEVSADEELGSHWLRDSLNTRREVAEAEAAHTQRLLQRRPPAFPFVTESEFKTLVSKVFAM